MDCPEADGHNKLLFSDLGQQDACKLCEISFLLAPLSRTRVIPFVNSRHLGVDGY